MDVHQSKLFTPGWRIAYRSRTSDILHDQSTPFCLLENPPHCWAADPFVFEYNGEAFVFAELYDSARGHGIIGYCRIGNERTSWHPAIIESFHMSYPYVYKEGNEIYMLPEMNQSGMQCRYRAVEFPDKWERTEPIRTGVQYADMTPFRWGSANLALALDVSSEAHRLMLLNLDDEKRDGEVKLSALDLRRPAGAMDREQCIRVAQDCVNGYGKGLVFYCYEITKDGDYAENELVRLYPEDVTLSKRMYLDGMHTYNVSEHYEVIDIATRMLSPSGFASRLASRMRRAFDVRKGA